MPLFPYAVLPLAGLFCLLLFAWTSFARQPVEAAARTAAAAAIQELNAEWARFDVSGQWVTLTGIPPSAAAADALTERVRTARVSTWLGPARPVTRVYANFSGSSTSAAAQQAETSRDRPAPIPAPPEPDTLGYEFKLRDGQMTLNGTVSGSAMHRRVGDAARGLISAPRIRQVTNALRVMEEPAPEGYEDAVMHGLNLLARCDAGTARFGDAQFDLTCEAPAEVAAGIAADARAPLPFGEARDIELLTRDDIDRCDETLARVLRGTRIQFQSASAAILPESEPVLERVAEAAQACPGTLRIEGHTDSTGGAEINQALSLRRAEAVREALVRRGVSPGRLSAQGFGASRPVADNLTTEGRARNRRIEMRIVRPGE